MTIGKGSANSDCLQQTVWVMILLSILVFFFKLVKLEVCLTACISAYYGQSNKIKTQVVMNLNYPLTFTYCYQQMALW